MITKLSGASIWSEDLNNLMPFYRDKVGLPIRLDTPGFAVLGSVEGPSLSLGTHSEVKGVNRDPARHMVGFETDDIDAEVRRLKAEGVEFVAEPETFDQVTVATFKDPEGNYCQLLQFA
jgi:predicted enzyme related to lactoylglutathione lyase